MGERRKETAYIQDNKTKITVPICALGGSIEKLDLPPK
jgi:hypothetical protein